MDSVFALANKPTDSVFALANKPTDSAFALANKPVEAYTSRTSVSTRVLFGPQRPGTKVPKSIEHFLDWPAVAAFFGR
jgi:hypothetical protein